MVQHSFLDEAESQVAYLDNACKTLRLAAEDMDKTIRRVDAGAGQLSG